MKVKIRKKVDELFALPPKPGKRKEIEETFPYAGQPYGGSRLQDPEAEHCGHVKRAKAQGRREVMDEIIDEEIKAVLEKFSKKERAKRRKKCDNPKGFTMKQFCKNQRTRSKKGEKKNEELEHSLDEIELRGSLGANEQVDVNWAAGRAEKVSQNKFEFGDKGIKLLVAPSGDHTKIIAYTDDQPAGYMSIVPFMDGVKVSTVSVKPEAQGKGVATTIYKYVIENNNLYSGDSQTPESKSLWQNYLARRYNVIAIDINTKKELSSITDGVYTKAGDPRNNIYLMIKQTSGLNERCQKGYKTHPTRKTKKMYGKTYRNCIKAKTKKRKRKNEEKLPPEVFAKAATIEKEGKPPKQALAIAANMYERGDLKERKKKRDPKKGTGKKPKGSGRRLYTDENPKDTVGVKFRTVQDIKDTLSKASFKSKSHKRQSQIINLIHQRARAAYSNAKDPKTKARLKKAYDYAKKRKEASKRKTKRMQKKK